MTWLHLKGKQAFNGEIQDKPGVTLLVPVKYVTSIVPGPVFRRPRNRTGINVGVFPPTHPAPNIAMPLSCIEAAIADLRIPIVETTITVQRPHYESRQGQK